MVEHGEKEHQGMPHHFEMQILEMHPSPLQRQSKEGFVIGNASPGTILNRKGEWGENLPPKLCVEGEEETEGKKMKTLEEGRCHNNDREEDTEDREGDGRSEENTETGRPTKRKKIENASENPENLVRKPLSVKEILKRMSQEGK